MGNDIIYIKGKKYFKFDEYEEQKEAWKVAIKLKKQYKLQYFILSEEKGLWFPEKCHTLYVTKIQKIW